MTSGLLPSGFVAPTVDEEIADLNSKFLANVDAGLDLAPDQPLGQIIGIFAEKLAEAYEVIATVYNSLNPNAAEGTLLANIALLSGTVPQVATYSTASAYLTLSAATTVSAGAVANVVNQPANRWVLLHDVTSVGAGAYVGQFRSQSPGPFAAPAGSLTVIATPVIGWTSVTNAGLPDALPGLPADTDATLRTRRQAELAGQGSGDTDALRAAVLKASPLVTQAFVFENTTNAVNSIGLPGKSFEVVIYEAGGVVGTTAAFVAQAIWNNKPSGIQSAGSIATTILDSSGNPHVVYFQRAQQLRTYVRCTTTPSSLTAAQTASIKADLVAYVQSLGLGASIIALPFHAAALSPAILNNFITDIPVFQFDFVASPTNTANLPVGALQVATLQAADILVNGV